MPCLTETKSPDRERPVGALVARGGIEPPTYRFSGGRSYQLSYLAEKIKSP